MATTKTGTPVNFVKVPTTANFDDITTKVDGTIYFIVDAKKIYLDGVMYGFNDTDVANKFVKLTGDTMTGDLIITDGGMTTNSLTMKPGRIDFPDNGDGMSRYISDSTGLGIVIAVGGTQLFLKEGGLSLYDGQGDDPITLDGVADPIHDSSAVNKGYLDTNVIDKIGEANGIASLDNTGKVPSAQLPSYVDDVIEYSAKASFPATGETGKLYIDLSNNNVWRWSGSAYVNVSDGNAHLTLGTTASTAYYGDKGKTAYDHSQLESGNPHKVTKANVSLGSVMNYGIADDDEAKAGIVNNKYMTPLRTKEAIEELAPRLSWTVVS